MVRLCQFSVYLFIYLFILTSSRPGRSLLDVTGAKVAQRWSRSTMWSRARGPNSNSCQGPPAPMYGRLCERQVRAPPALWLQVSPYKTDLSLSLSLFPDTGCPPPPPLSPPVGYTLRVTASNGTVTCRDPRCLFQGCVSSSLGSKSCKFGDQNIYIYIYFCPPCCPPFTNL